MRAPNCWASIEYAYAHPEVLADANRRWAAAAPGIFYEHTNEISASSAGNCVLQEWAKLHDKLDLPETYPSMLAKMEGGTMYGARIAALFAAGYCATHEDVSVEIEIVSEHDGIPGHVDIRITQLVELDLSVLRWVIEVKTSFWTGDFSGPMTSHLTQACKYALGQGAEGFTIATLLPAAQKKRGSNEPAVHFVQNDYFTADYVEATNADYARLKRSRDDEPPTQDVKEAWRCVSCRYSACPKNVNPLKSKAKVPA